MSKYVSISHLTPEAHQSSGEDPEALMVWGLDLPAHVDTERIVVNASRLKVLHKVGAISASLVQSYDGEITETTPNIVGINADGSAMAGRSGITKKADKSKASYLDSPEILAADAVQSMRPHPEKDPISKNFGHPTILHKLNKPELASRVADRVQDDGSRSETAWANLLDVAIRESMRKGGKEHLTGRGGAGRYFSGLLTAQLVYPVFDVLAKQPSLLGSVAGATYMLGQLTPQLDHLIVKLRLGVDVQRRWSLLPFDMQPDRYIALNGLSRLPGLIKERK